MIFINLFYKNVFKTSFLLMFGLFAIFLTTRFGNSLSEAVAGNVATRDILKLISLKTLISFEDILPISMFMGIFITATNLVNNREWLAIQSCGMSKLQLLSSALKIGLFTAFLAGISSLLVNPILEAKLREMKEETKNDASIEGIKSGVFVKFGDSQTFYSEKKVQNNKKFADPFVVKTDKAGKEVLRSETAFIEIQRSTGDKFAVFERGTSVLTNSEEKSYSTTNFDRYLIRIEQKKFADHHKYLDFIPSLKLLKSDNLLHKIELEWRIVPLIVCIFMSIASVLIAISNHNKGWHSGVLITVAIYFTYFNSLGTAKSMLRKGDIPFEIGLWPVHVLFYVSLAILVFWNERKSLCTRIRIIK